MEKFNFKLNIEEEVEYDILEDDKKLIKKIQSLFNNSESDSNLYFSVSDNKVTVFKSTPELYNKTLNFFKTKEYTVKSLNITFDVITDEGELKENIFKELSEREKLKLLSQVLKNTINFLKDDFPAFREFYIFHNENKPIFYRLFLTEKIKNV